MTLEIRLILVAVLVLLGCGGVLYWNFHEREKGATQCHNDDLQAAKTQLAQQAKDLAAYQKQLGEANEKHAEDQRLLAAAAATPVPVLLCHKAGPEPVPKVPAAASSGSAASGATDQVRQPDFDPSPALRRLSVGYERRVSGYRDAVNQWPKPPPGS